MNRCHHKLADFSFSKSPRTEKVCWPSEGPPPPPSCQCYLKLLGSTKTTVSGFMQQTWALSTSLVRHELLSESASWWRAKKKWFQKYKENIVGSAWRFVQAWSVTAAMRARPRTGAVMETTMWQMTGRSQYSTINAALLHIQAQFSHQSVLIGQNNYNLL